MSERNPYLIEGPALISFSGGRSSGYMLKHILDAHGGRLPDGVHVVFANTGKENPETLDFVQQCGERLGVHITWLEYRARSGPITYEVVSHNSASRSGEPFEAAIRDRKALPNPGMAFCSFELKTLTIARWVTKDFGWTEWLNVVGMRADERDRIANGLARNEKGRDPYENIYPMALAGVTKRTVGDFWRAQPFDLGLPLINDKTPDGNCDDCFKKGLATTINIIRRRPHSVQWWKDQEQKTGHTFRSDRPSYAEIERMAGEPDLLDFLDDDTRPCGCHD